VRTVLSQRLRNLSLSLAPCGRYRSVAERMLAAQLVHSRDDMSRILSLDFLNCQLVWRELSDVLLFVLPLLHSLRSRHGLRVVLRRRSSLAAPALHHSSLLQLAFAGRVTSRTDDRDSAACQLCSRALVLRCTAVPCGHQGCYFCLTAACRGNAKLACSVCSTRVVAVRRA
jgi:peroxin-2